MRERVRERVRKKGKRVDTISSHELSKGPVPLS